MIIRGLCRQDRVPHRRVERRAVGEDDDAIVVVDGSLACGLDDVQEVVAVGAQRDRDVIVDAWREQQHQHEPRQERDA